jgi:hypothetical protein
MVRNSALIKGLGKIVTVGPPFALRIGELSGGKSTKRRWIMGCERGRPK